MVNEYKSWSSDKIDELLSNYLIDSWSYSRVSTFARQEKEFEMRYLYNVYSKSSATAVAGQAYHAALEYFFGKQATGEQCDIVDLQLVATAHIDSIPPDQWKIQKTRPTVQDCIDAATKNAYAGIENFMKEKDLYLSEIDKYIGLEFSITEWVVINGVSIPLPVNARIDLVVKTKDGKIVIIDHKLKMAFTAEEEINFVIGKQAITYTVAYETKYKDHVDEVWFIENKISKNRDQSPQLSKTKVIMDNGTRRLYEAMLYEPLRRMIEAVSNPDYIYLVNDTDNFTSKAELYEFWAKTMLDEVEGFDIAENKKELIKKRQRKIKDSTLTQITPNVLKNFKAFAQEFIPLDYSNKDMTKEQKIEALLRNFGLMVKVAHTFDGFSSDTFLLDVGAGVAINNVKRYRMDIANALSVPNIRISENLTVYEGKSYLTVEAGKKSTTTLMWDKTLLAENKLPIGVDNFGKTVFWDLNNQSTPHMLVCGATGCLAGDTEISVYVPHYKRPTKVKTIETLFNIQEGRPNPQTWIKNKHKRKMLVRSLDEKTNKFTYSPFEVIYSGKKQCYKMTTDAGRVIEATADHKFLTSSGWHRLSELKIGDKIMHRPPVREYNGKEKQISLKEIFTKFHPRKRRKTIVDRTSGKPYSYCRTPYHHFVYEAHKNGLSEQEYKDLLNDYDGRELFYIPKGMQIDHIDGDRLNNDISNLQMLSINDHARKTIDTAEGVFGHFSPEETTILSIEPTEVKDTYDISCLSENHNFIANGLVVHNSGKSVSLKSTIMYAIEAGVDDITIFDPKYEFRDLKSKKINVINDIEDIEYHIGLLVMEMEDRVKSGENKKKLVIFDEFADAIMNARLPKQLSYGELTLDENLRKVLQKGRSTGIRVVVATQRADVKVIAGNLKVNLPVQVCFRVPKAVDSNVVIDEDGGETLMGRGDGLIKSPEYLHVQRFQGFYYQDDGKEN